MRTMRFKMVCAAALAALCQFGAIAHAQPPAQPTELNIPAQSLRDALTSFGRQTGLQVIYTSTEVTDALRAPAIVGTFTTQAALTRLLANTALRFEYLDDRTVAILGREQTTTAVIPRPDLRVAQTDDVSMQRVAEDEKQTPKSSSNKGALQSEEIVVTGSHIRGVEETAAPSLQFTREDIAKTGYSTLEQLFETLPQNFGSMTYSGQYAQEGGSRLAQQNYDRATAIDLRGLGADSTLTLLNGQRRAGNSFARVVDISSIPLSVIDKVEVVTGGRSAVYGADAVAGVVNLVTRREFKGVETQFTYGGTSRGGERLQFDTITGMSFGRGGFVASYDYSEDQRIDLSNTAYLVSPNYYGGNWNRLDIQPELSRHSGFLSGSLAVTESLQLHADALFARKKTRSVNETIFGVGSAPSVFADENTSDQYTYAAGAHVDLGRQWALNVDGAYSVVDSNWLNDVNYISGSYSFAYQIDRDAKATMTSGTLVADGPLGTFAGITPRAAVGVENRRESYYLYDYLYQKTYSDDDRRVKSAFAELLVPLVERGTKRGLHKLELTLAGRHDDYDDFGSTFNPQAGIVWRPVETLAVRTSYSKAFRAPGLVERSPSSVVNIQNRTDPTTGGVTPVLQWTGTDPNLGPETAKTWTFGVDIEPASLAGTRISLSYFDIAYKERIDEPAVNSVDQELVLVRENRFADLIYRAPSAALIAQIDALTRDDLYYNYSGTPFDRHTQNIFAVFPNLVVFDNRTSNIAVEKLNGVDLQIDTRRDTSVGQLSFGLNGTYTLQHDRSVTAASPAFELLNEVGKPVGFRVRGNAGWERGAYATSLFVTYTDSYSNPFSTPAGTIATWMTVDANLRIDGGKLSTAPWLNNLELMLSANNLLDRDPPRFVGGTSGFRFDVANSNPIGRYLSMRVVKGWR